MRYLVLTDIHANLEALDAVPGRRRARAASTQTLVLGDLVGYGADPNAVIERVQALEAGRDRARQSRQGGVRARTGRRVQRRRQERRAAGRSNVLTPEHRDWLARAAAGPIDVDDVVEICHGSPFDEDAYIFDELDAVRALKVSTRPLCLFGHTHYPVTFELSDDAFDSVGSAGAPQMQVQMKDGCEVSGQSRIGRSAARRRSARGVRDRRHGAHRVELFRIELPGGRRAERRSSKAGLPEVLAQRLAVGR